jgi:hypothetical protein
MDERIILKWIYKRNGIDLAYERDKMQAFGSIGISLWFHNMWGFSGLAEELFTSQEGLCFFGVVSENLK